jgi:hypothetical protein
LSAPIAPQTADAMSDRVEVITRAANVEALKPCSAPIMLRELALAGHLPGVRKSSW